MLISRENSERRLNNSMNLMNRPTLEYKRSSAMSLFVRPSSVSTPNGNDRNELMVPPRDEPEEIEETSVPSSLSLALAKITQRVDSLNQTSSALESERKELIDPASPIDNPIDNLLDSADSKIELASAHNKAITLMGKAIEQLEEKLPYIKGEKLPSVIASLGKVVTDIRREQNDRNERNKDEITVIHFYCPEPRQMETFDVIEVS